jgi:hypothetical protein
MIPTATSGRPCIYMRWFARRKAASHEEVAGGIVRSDASYLRILNNLPDWDIYVGMNPSTTWRKIKVSDADIAEVIGIVLDIDPLPSAGKDFPPLHSTASLALSSIESVLGRLPHCAVISTGRGLQVWLKVQFSIIESPSHRSHWRYAIKQFVQQTSRHFHSPHYTIDTSCTDLSRLVRAIGSINQRTHTRVVPIQFHLYPPIQPDTFLSRYPLPKNPAPPTLPLHPISHWWKIFHLLTDTAQRYLTEGITEPGRHAAAYATAASLRDVGVERPLAERLVTTSASLCSPPLPHHDALRACSNAFSSQSGGPIVPQARHIPQIT